MRSLFIYYQIAASQSEEAASAARAMQCSLCERHTGLQAGLWRRPEEKDGMQTWMETYTSNSGIDPALQAQIAEAARAVEPWIQGVRHVEVFIPCVS